MKHGAWHKRQTYRDMTFRQVPNLTIEERQAELNKKLKPYSLDLSKHIPIEAAHGPGGAPPPPPETFYLQTASADNLQTAGLDNILWTV